jgi:hypothetical protein
MSLAKIREELYKEKPSVKDILSYLFEILNEEQFSSLSNLKFYNIIGEIFKLVLNNKLSFELLYEPLYKKIKKKIKILYGEKKTQEMEQFLIENFSLYGPKQILNRIEREFEKAEPSKEINWRLFLKTRILSYLNDVLTKEEYKSLSDSEFYEIVGELFKLNPDFFRDYLHEDFFTKFGKLRGMEKNTEMVVFLSKNYGYITKEIPRIPEISLFKKVMRGILIFLISIVLILIVILIIAGINPLILIGIICILCVYASIDYYCDLL